MYEYWMSILKVSFIYFYKYAVVASGLMNEGLELLPVVIFSLTPISEGWSLSKNLVGEINKIMSVA